MKEQWSTAMYILKFRNSKCKVTSQRIFSRSWTRWARQTIKKISKAVREAANSFQGHYSACVALAWQNIEKLAADVDNFRKKYGRIFNRKVGSVVYLQQKKGRYLKENCLSAKLLR